MDYWDWIQDRLAEASWVELVRLTEELGLYEHQRIGDELFPEMPQSLGLDIIEPPGSEA